MYNNINLKDWRYAEFKSLPPEVRDKNNIKHTAKRLDCVSMYAECERLRGLKNVFNKKGQLYIYKEPNRSRYSSTKLQKSLPSHGLTVKGVNLSSLYIDDTEHPNLAYGNPPKKEIIGGKKPINNPFYDFREDLYLFIKDDSFSSIELIIIPNSNPLQVNYYQMLRNGELDEKINFFRDNSKPVFEY